MNYSWEWDFKDFQTVYGKGWFDLYSQEFSLKGKAKQVTASVSLLNCGKVQLSHVKIVRKDRIELPEEYKTFPFLQYD